MAKGAKSKFIQVWLQSIVSGHRVMAIRPRIKEEVKLLRYDPMIQQYSIYKETRKIRSCHR